MNDLELINKIKKLKQIKPRKDWVLSVKSRILGEELTYRGRVSVFAIFRGVIFQPKVAYASLIILGLFISSFSFADGSLPGDLLYPLKRIVEKSQMLFVSEQERPKVDLELANKRLEELTKIAQENKTPKLAPALDEFQKSATEAVKNLKQPQKISREVITETKKLLENKEKVEALGVVIGGTEELDDAAEKVIESQIKDLETRSLTEEQAEILGTAKENFEQGNLSQALENILQINPN